MRHQINPRLRSAIAKLWWGWSLVPADTGEGEELIRRGLANNIGGYLGLTEAGRAVGDEIIDEDNAEVSERVRPKSDDGGGHRH